MRDLIRERGAERALVAGHDWGAGVAWLTAMNHPEVVERLAILNGPHPRRMLQGLRRPRQLARSWYMLFFQLPWLPELAARARALVGLAPVFESEARPGAFTPQDIERYVEAWSQPGAPTGMINSYRAALRQTPGRAEARILPVEAPTLVIWGERDRHLGRRAGRAGARRRPQPRARRPPPRGVPLGAPGRARAGLGAADRVLRLIARSPAAQASFAAFTAAVKGWFLLDRPVLGLVRNP